MTLYSFFDDNGYFPKGDFTLSEVINKILGRKKQYRLKACLVSAINSKQYGLNIMLEIFYDEDCILINRSKNAVMTNHFVIGYKNK